MEAEQNRSEIQILQDLLVARNDDHTWTGRNPDGKTPNHTQLHNKEDENLEVVYGFICTYGFNWDFFIYFCRPNQEDNSRVKKCTNISKSSKYKLEF